MISVSKLERESSKHSKDVLALPFSENVFGHLTITTIKCNNAFTELCAVCTCRHPTREKGHMYTLEGATVPVPVLQYSR